MVKLPWRRLALAALCLTLPAAAEERSPLLPLDFDRGAAGLGLALRRVGTSGRVLYVTAHPDDENNAMLVRLSRGLGLRTALLTVTRGEGGQNAIGPELFEALGVLRSAELMSMHRYDAVEQYFGNAYEFGYSFSVEETLAKWGHDETLGDVVRVVRAFRPDVILTLPPENAGGGRHHETVGRLTREAFRVAADAARYPEQLREGLRPWQARKLYAGGVGGFGTPLPGPLVHVAVGTFDPLLGMSWQQIGSRARAMHRCQGAPQLVADPGPADSVYSLLDAEPKPGAPESDVLDWIDTSLTGLGRFAPAPSAIVPALGVLQSKALAARAAFDPSSPGAAVAPLVEALASARALRGVIGTELADDARFEFLERLADEEADLEHALLLASGVVIEARAEDGLVTPGERFGVSLAIWNEGRAAIALEDVALELPPEWSAERREGEAGEIAPSGVRRVRFVVTVPDRARVTQPYWRKVPGRDRNELLVPADDTLPWSPTSVVARMRCRIGGPEVTRREPVLFRYPAPAAGGEKRHVLQIVPELAPAVSPEIVPVPTGGRSRPFEVRAYVKSEIQGPADAVVRLELPAGWSFQPASVPLHYAYEGEEIAARFTVTPPAAIVAGKLPLHVVAVREGREYRQSVQVVEYPHVARHQLVHPADTRLLALDVRTAPAASVGYVMGSGDGIADAIRGLGVPLTLLSADDLAFGDLARYTTIVTGIRAYETRPDLRAYQGRVMRWVEAGGHLVVQYNRAAFNAAAPSTAPAPGLVNTPSPFAPYPAWVTSDRITDETAPVRALAPGHPLLTTPNHIGPRDWDGWVQERGIQLLATRDPRYTDLLASSDPFPENPGEKLGLLVDAKVGAGTWTYLGLVLFREVPAGVPGAWRLLANLVSRPRPR